MIHVSILCIEVIFLIKEDETPIKKGVGTSNNYNKGNNNFQSNQIILHFLH